MSGRGSTGAGATAAGAAGCSAARRGWVSRAARARDWRSASAQREAAVASWTIASGHRLWAASRSEERRVGKEGRSGGSPYREKEKSTTKQHKERTRV